MIPIPSGVRVWIATGHTDMRRGMDGLALQVQESLKRDPYVGDLYIFRGRPLRIAPESGQRAKTPSVRRRAGPDWVVMMVMAAMMAMGSGRILRVKSTFFVSFEV
ncbi:IS66 family insertion sequence element accessory protein TnpB [Methylocystis sp. H62]|uniref:IS66 family insertion sequence element accessory protein TnpB n=1 Tax=Methylocystis sp. H62 TaxID=2785789 RepID=UPI0018C1FE70|nr:IS66 family insertion sequence element accessory protein TnpB [Methylocystis sp. H62]MBG0792067.1 IS66 family insertion sequence element accessory protein TnpB [Methylocystis sp. H62]